MAGGEIKMANVQIVKNGGVGGGIYGLAFVIKKILWSIVAIIVLVIIFIGYNYYFNNPEIRYKNRIYRSLFSLLLLHSNNLSSDEVKTKYGEIVFSGESNNDHQIFFPKNTANLITIETPTIILVKISDFYKKYGLVGGP